MERSKTISILKGIKDGKIKASDLKRLLNAKKVDPNHIPVTLPDGPQIEIKIRTTFADVLLDYPWNPENIQTPAPGETGYVNDIPICIALRSDARFKHLDQDTKYIIAVPDPGVEVLNLGKYFGEMTIKQVMQESDFEW